MSRQHIKARLSRSLRRTCSLIRFRLAPVPTLMILLANSTPIVCDESVRHSFFTKRCNKHDLVEQVVSLPAAHCADRIDGALTFLFRSVPTK